MPWPDSYRFRKCDFTANLPSHAYFYVAFNKTSIFRQDFLFFFFKFKWFEYLKRIKAEIKSIATRISMHSPPALKLRRCMHANWVYCFIYDSQFKPLICPLKTMWRGRDINAKKTTACDSFVTMGWGNVWQIAATPLQCYSYQMRTASVQPANMLQSIKPVATIISHVWAAGEAKESPRAPARQKWRGSKCIDTTKFTHPALDLPQHLLSTWNNSQIKLRIDFDDYFVFWVVKMKQASFNIYISNEYIF